jgi:hypothetical protein
MSVWRTSVTPIQFIISDVPYLKRFLAYWSAIALLGTCIPTNVTAAPAWSLVDRSFSGKAQYYKYWSVDGTEVGATSVEENPTVNPSHLPPITYGFVQNPTVARNVCPLANKPLDNVYWFDENTGAPLEGTYPIPPPTEFNISEPNYWEGFKVQAAVHGSLSNVTSGQYAVATSFYTDDPCFAASTEFGFVTYLTTASQVTQFYYSIRNNCYSSGGCRSADYWGSTDPNESDPQNQDNGTNLPLFTALTSGAEYLYSAYITPRVDAMWDGSCWSNYDFVIEIDDSHGVAVYGPMRLPISTLFNGGAFAACALLRKQGYIVTGAQVSYSPPILNAPAYFQVTGVWGGINACTEPNRACTGGPAKGR